MNGSASSSRISDRLIPSTRLPCVTTTSGNFPAADPGNPGTNYTTYVTGAPLRHGDKPCFFGSWESRAAGTVKVAPAATAVVIDTVDDRRRFDFGSHTLESRFARWNFKG